MALARYSTHTATQTRLRVPIPPARSPQKNTTRPTSRDEHEAFACRTARTARRSRSSSKSVRIYRRWQDKAAFVCGRLLVYPVFLAFPENVYNLQDLISPVLPARSSRRPPAARPRPTLLASASLCWFPRIFPYQTFALTRLPCQLPPLARCVQPPPPSQLLFSHRSFDSPLFRHTVEHPYRSISR